MTLAEVAAQTHGELRGDDVEFARLSTDTRTLMPGDVYLALSGERFDGNDFVDQALERGAVAAIVSRPVESTLPRLRVPDTHRTLGDIARLNRSRSSARVIALTGSQGKTTVKEMLGAILRQVAATLTTEANLNNTIGVPLTLLHLEKRHQYAVVEMGADRAGEIAFSAAVALPDIAIITNANAAHIEGFGSLQGIVEAKGEIIDAVPDTGTVILNADDANVQQWIDRAGKRKVVLFGSKEAIPAPQYYPGRIDIGDRGQVSFDLVSPQGEIEITLGLPGKHNVFNALAAASAAMEAGVGLDAVARGLSGITPVAGRLKPRSGINGCTVLDDTYNASPSSFAAAIDVLMTFRERKVLVAGDMKELGKEAESAHRYVGSYAAEAGVDELLTVGELSRLTADSWGSTARHFPDQQALIEACKQLANNNTVFLVKGSRGSRMEKVANELSMNGGV